MIASSRDRLTGMFSWLGLKGKTAPDSKRAADLYAAVRNNLRDDDEESVIIVASIAALLLCVADADTHFDEDEQRVVRSTLEQVQGLDASGTQAIIDVLKAQTVRIVSEEGSSYARQLLKLGDEDLRRQVLQALVTLAAADGNISVSETNALREITVGLGLTQADYTAAQAEHRDKLEVLRKEQA